MNVLYGIFTGLVLSLFLKAIQPTDPVMTGLIAFFAGMIYGGFLMLLMLKKKINEEANNE